MKAHLSPAARATIEIPKPHHPLCHGPARPSANSQNWGGADVFRLLLATALVASLATTAAATNLFVDLNSPNAASPYTNWITAATNIQDAVDAAQPGDQIFVAAGCYQVGGRTTSDGMANRVVVDKPVTVQSVNGQTGTLIDGSRSLRCAYLANGAVLSGFTLTNGAAGNGCGVYCTSTNEQLRNCRLINNVSLSPCAGPCYGAGAYSGTLVNCSLSGNNGLSAGGGAAYSVLFNCTLTGNSAVYYGGGAYSATLNSCTVSGNSAGWYGGGALECTLSDCAIKDNTVGYRGGGACDCTLSSCTVTGNSVTDSSSFGGGVAGATAANNCIIYNNFTQIGYEQNHNGGTLNYCCTTPLPSSGTGNFTDDPRFVNYAGGDLHLSTNSLCINTGGNAYVTDSTDLDGNPRLVGGVVDVGAYECQTVLPVPVVPTLLANYTQVIPGLVVGLTGRIGGRATASRWEFGDGTIVSNQLPNVSHSWAAPGNYVVALRAYNDSYPDGATATVTIQVGPSVVYVTPACTQPVWPYSSWATAATNIQQAVDAACVGGSVLVSNGVYRTGGRVVYGAMSNRVVVSKPVPVQSVSGPGVTVIEGYRQPGTTDGNSNIRCIYLTNGAALSGFTLTNGGTRGLGDYRREQSGGGVWCESASTVVSNCVLAGNSASYYGGGVYFGTLFDCKLAGNSVSNCGGGAYNATLNNCLVISNRATGAASPRGGGVNLATLWNCVLAGNSAVNGSGGAVYQSTLANCTLVSNTAAIGGGGSESTFRNCVIYYNTASNGSNYSSGYYTSVTNCCTVPQATGAGNFTNAPLFVDLPHSNFHLQSNSPCINAGQNGSALSSTDLEGNPRIQGGTVDLGAYEYQNPSSVLSYAWAKQFGLPTDGSADSQDNDGDRLSNYGEWLAGTNPTNAQSVLQMLWPSNAASGLKVSWQSVNGRTYFLQQSTNTGAQPPFLTIRSNLIGQTGRTTFTDGTATNSGPYFYRVGVQQ